MSDFQGYQMRMDLQTGDERIMPGAFKVDGKDVPVFNYDHSKVIGTGQITEDGVFEFTITDDDVLKIIKGDPLKDVKGIELAASVAVTKDGDVVEAVAYPERMEPKE